MKVATIDNVKVGDEVWIKSKVVNILDGRTYSICTNFTSFTNDGKHVMGDHEPSLFISEPEFKPRKMKVWDDDESGFLIKTVVGMYGGQYIIQHADGSYVTYKNAREIPEPTIKLDIPKSKLEAVKKLLAE